MPGERGTRIEDAQEDAQEDTISVIHRNFLQILPLIIIVARKNHPRPQFPDEDDFLAWKLLDISILALGWFYRQWRHELSYAFLFSCF